MPRLILIPAAASARRGILGEVTAELRARGYPEPTVRAAADWGAVLAESGGGLFEGRSVTVIEDADRLGEMPARYARMIEGEDAASVVILMTRARSTREAPDGDEGAEEGEPRARELIPKDLISKCTVMKAPPAPAPWSKERDASIREAAARYGVSVAADAVGMLKDAISDLGELTSATAMLSHRASLSGERTVTAADVVELCLSDGERDLLTLLDGICACDAETAMRALDDIARHFDLIPLASALSNRIRAAVYIAEYGRGASPILKAIGASDHATREAETAARRYPKEALTEYAAGLFRLSANEKAGKGAGLRDLELMTLELLSSIKR